CLFASHGHDLRALLRGGADDAAIAAAVDHLWAGRDDRYSQRRTAATHAIDTATAPADERRVEMHYIGG
ncbi:MAG: GTP 3',8-cyclase MoaA, partial [Caulobacter sp.]|nr:GTP 3',8-cyclase MoaA [Vitreoscilla sp.]